MEAAQSRFGDDAVAGHPQQERVGCAPCADGPRGGVELHGDVAVGLGDSGRDGAQGLLKKNDFGIGGGRIGKRDRVWRACQ